MTAHYSYKDIVQRAERITWRVEDLIGGAKTLDFSRPFMPETLARTAQLEFLSPSDRLVLNQVRGCAYLSTFGLVEEFILPFVVDHARGRLGGDDWRTRAYLDFAGEEAKHIHLFHRFREAFDAGFGSPCETIGPGEAIAAHVLKHAPLAVALLTLHIEWMTQRHYTESIEGDQNLDPAFKSLLLHHWMEEHQHARLDALMVEEIARSLSTAEIDRGIDEYLALGAFLDNGLKQQASFDLDSLESKTGRRLSASERGEFLAAQHQANRWTYIGSGMTHPMFLDSLGKLSAERRRQIEAVAPQFC